MTQDDPAAHAAPVITALEARVAELEASLFEVQEYLPMALVQLTLPSLDITYMNRMASIVLGDDPGGARPRLNIRDILRADEAERITALTHEMHRRGLQPDGTYSRKGQQEIHETVGLRRDGTEIAIEFQSMFVLDHRGRPVGARVMFRDISERKAAEREREALVQELQDALASVRTLEGLLPICAWCRKVRDDRGYWSELEAYIHRHSDARFSHGICPQCLENFEAVRDSRAGR